MTEFKKLMEQTGLSTRGASILMRVRFDTIKNWKQGKARTPEQILKQMRRYAQAAERIFNDTL